MKKYEQLIYSVVGLIALFLILVAVNYIGSHVNGSASTELPIVTGITGSSLILIPSSGRVPILSVAAIVAGSWRVYVDAVQGAA